MREKKEDGGILEEARKEERRVIMRTTLMLGKYRNISDLNFDLMLEGILKPCSAPLPSFLLLS